MKEKGREKNEERIEKGMMSKDKETDKRHVKEKGRE